MAEFVLAKVRQKGNSDVDMRTAWVKDGQFSIEKIEITSDYKREGRLQPSLATEMHRRILRLDRRDPQAIRPAVALFQGTEEPLTAGDYPILVGTEDYAQAVSSANPTLPVIASVNVDKKQGVSLILRHEGSIPTVIDMIPDEVYVICTTSDQNAREVAPELAVMISRRSSGQQLPGQITCKALPQKAMIGAGV